MIGHNLQSAQAGSGNHNSCSGEHLSLPCSRYPPVSNCPELVPPSLRVLSCSDGKRSDKLSV